MRRNGNRPAEHHPDHHNINHRPEGGAMNDDQLDRMLRDADPHRPGVVARLGGAEQTLLEEIVSQTTAPHGARRFSSWKWRTGGALAAAAAVTGVLAVPALVGTGSVAGPIVSGGAPEARAPEKGRPIVFSAAVLKAAEDNPRLLIGRPGWTVTTVYGFAEESGSITFANGDRTLAMDWRPAKEYPGYLESRRVKVSKPEPVEVDGWAGSRFTYSAGDFAIMLKPRDGAFSEMRTSGTWTRATFDETVAAIKQVDARTWLAALPPEVVTPDQARAEVARVLADVPLPPGLDAAEVKVRGANDPYQFGVAVTGQVGCAWIAEWERARKAGDDAAAGRAVDAMQSSRRWKVLNDMNADGDFPEVFWEFADRIAGKSAGKSEGYREGLGCA